MEKNKTLTFKESILNALEDELTRNRNLVICGEDILDEKFLSISSHLTQKFPQRVIFNIPLIEEMLGYIGLGMSFGGITPIIQLDHSSFVTLALDSIYRIGIWRYRMGERQSPCVIFRIGHNGHCEGADLFASFLGLLLGIPGIWIAVPNTPEFANYLLRASLYSKKPVIFFEDKRLYQKSQIISSGKILNAFPSSVKMTEGEDITLIGWGWTAYLLLDAVPVLRQKGISAEVLALQTLYPLDKASITASIRKTGKALIVDEEMERGSAGEKIYREIKKEFPSHEIGLVAAKNVPRPAHPEYKRLLTPSVEDVVRVSLTFCEAPPC